MIMIMMVMAMVMIANGAGLRWAFIPRSGEGMSGHAQARRADGRWHCPFSSSRFNKARHLVWFAQIYVYRAPADVSNVKFLQVHSPTGQQRKV